MRYASVLDGFPRHAVPCAGNPLPPKNYWRQCPPRPNTKSFHTLPPPLCESTARPIQRRVAVAVRRTECRLGTPSTQAIRCPTPGTHTARRSRPASKVVRCLGNAQAEAEAGTLFPRSASCSRHQRMVWGLTFRPTRTPYGRRLTPPFGVTVQSPRPIERHSPCTASAQTLRRRFRMCIRGFRACMPPASPQSLSCCRGGIAVSGTSFVSRPFASNPFVSHMWRFVNHYAPPNPSLKRDRPQADGPLALRYTSPNPSPLSSYEVVANWLRGAPFAAVPHCCTPARIFLVEPKTSSP